MKYGNFVGQGWLPFDKKEAENILLHLSKQLESTFGKGFFKDFKYEIQNYDGKDDAVAVKHVFITASLSKPFNGRNFYKARVKGCSEVYFFVTKNKKGYLEIKDEKYPYNPLLYKRDYDNCPEFSYGCNMSVNGTEQRFRCRNMESIQNWSPYVYGTEIEDLTYDSKDMEGLKKAITQKPDGMSVECLEKKRYW